MEKAKFDTAVALQNDINDLEGSIDGCKFMMDKSLQRIDIVDKSGYVKKVNLRQFSSIADDILDFVTRRLEDERDDIKEQFRNL